MSLNKKATQLRTTYKKYLQNKKQNILAEHTYLWRNIFAYLILVNARIIIFIIKIYKLFQILDSNI